MCCPMQIIDDDIINSLLGTAHPRVARPACHPEAFKRSLSLNDYAEDAVTMFS